MIGRTASLALALALTLGGCYPPLSAQWTSAEAPKDIFVESVAKQVDLHFAGTGLVPGDAARLRRLVAHGAIVPGDRVRVAAGGGAELAEARVAAVAQELLPYGIVVGRMPGGALPANRGVLNTGRYLVSTPACPNWSGYPAAGDNNANSSNWGCATAIGLARIVESPADLVEGRRGGPTDANSAAAAVQRVETDRVFLPGAAGLSQVGIAGGTPATGVGSTASGVTATAP